MRKKKLKLRDIQAIKTYDNVYCFYTMVYLKLHGWNRKEILKEANLVWKEGLFEHRYNDK
tara:strand:- start:291 stop:470 length:180 start_codon:yes stop_codon:yes gene_type:complete